MKSHSIPKISGGSFVINGEKVNVRFVRDSTICRLLTDKEYITIGHTIYVRGKLLVQRVVRSGLDDMHNAPHWKTKLFKLLQT